MKMIGAHVCSQPEMLAQSYHCGDSGMTRGAGRVRENESSSSFSPNGSSSSGSTLSRSAAAAIENVIGEVYRRD